MTLPNPLTSSGLVLGLVFQTVWGYQTTHSLSGAATYLVGAIGGMVLGIWLYDAIQILGSLLLGQIAQGGGDAKLMGMLGAWLGWSGVLLTGAIASGLGSVVMGGAMALGLLGRHQKFPLGPFLALGGVISLFAGDRLIASYQSFMFGMSPTTNFLMAGIVFVVLIAYLFYVRRSKRRLKSDGWDD
jgi:leader peptidase (prepilin peptidase)/N-methyltransferase